MKVPSIEKMRKMKKKEVEHFVNEGLAEVCEMLATYDKVTPRGKKQFLKYADTFRKFGAIHNIKPDKTKSEVIEMVKKLTDQEKEDREVKKILSKIRSLEKSHPQPLVERACFRYKNANLDKRKAEKEMKDLEERLQDAKRRLR